MYEVVQPGAREWVSYWRSPDGGVEAMQAYFRSHSYHRHSHETYSFGVTECGSQSFTCRGGTHISAAGMVMAFNPDDPHDGHASTRDGFQYRMIHIAPETVTHIIGDSGGDLDDAGSAPRPLFGEPVIHDPVLARALRNVHDALGHGTALERDEHLAATVRVLVRRASTTGLAATPDRLSGQATRRLAMRVRSLIDDMFAQDLATEDLAAATGCSRYAVHRAFHATYGMAPSDYQRQLRLRAARSLLATGRRPADVAAEVGFADQAHLTRWFRRWFGITPGLYRSAAPPAPPRSSVIRTIAVPEPL